MLVSANLPTRSFTLHDGCNNVTCCDIVSAIITKCTLQTHSFSYFTTLATITVSVLWMQPAWLWAHSDAVFFCRLLLFSCKTNHYFNVTLISAASFGHEVRASRHFCLRFAADLPMLNTWPFITSNNKVPRLLFACLLPGIETL